MVGVLVCNQDGVIIKSTFNDPSLSSNSMPNTILQIVDRAKDALKDNDELTFVKMKTKKTEFIVVPGELNLIDYKNIFIKLNHFILKITFLD